MKNSPELYQKIWDILVEHAGALKEGQARFIQFCLEKDDFGSLREYRFCGHLGFGGKFWRNDGRLYISCYREDENKKRRKIIDKVNGLLAEITPEGGVYGPP